MAEPMSSSAIVSASAPMVIERAPASPPATLEGNGYTIQLRRFTAGGGSQGMTITIPADVSPQTLARNPMLLAAVLKDGDPIWSQYEPGFILVAALNAASYGLSLLEGDIYPIEGRLAVSDKAKIKYALSKSVFSDAPEIVTIADGTVSIPWETKREKGVYNGPNFKTTVTLHVKGWASPIVYTATMEAWFKGSNPNWRSNPQGMLELRAYAKACERVCPVGVQPDEAPPLDNVTSKGGM